MENSHFWREVLRRRGMGFSDQEIALALNACLSYSTFEAAKFLLENGADPNFKEDSNETPVFTNRVDPCIIRLLMEYGADIQAKTPYYGENILPHIPNSQTGLFVLLGYDVNMKKPNGGTPLHYSNYSNSLFFIEIGMDVNARDGQGHTPLYTQTDPEIREVLRDAGGILE